MYPSCCIRDRRRHNSDRQPPIPTIIFSSSFLHQRHRNLRVCVFFFKFVDVPSKRFMPTTSLKGPNNATKSLTPEGTEVEQQIISCESGRIMLIIPGGRNRIRHASTPLTIMTAAAAFGIVVASSAARRGVASSSSSSSFRASSSSSFARVTTAFAPPAAATVERPRAAAAVPGGRAAAGGPAAFSAGGAAAARGRRAVHRLAADGYSARPPPPRPPPPGP